MPDYSQSTSAEVDLFIRRAVPDESFAGMVSEEEKRHGGSLSVRTLIVLSLLKEHRRLTMPQLHEFSRLEERQAVDTGQSVLWRIWWDQASWRRPAAVHRSHILCSKVYKADNALPAYARQNTISATRQRGLALELAEKNSGEATSSEVMDLLGLSYTSAYRLLKKMEDEGKPRYEGKGRSSRYLIA